MTEERLALLIEQRQAAATELVSALDAASSAALRRWMQWERIGAASMEEKLRLQIALVEGFLAFLATLGNTSPLGE